MPPCMTGNEKALDFDPIDVDDLIVVQQHFFIVDRHLRQLVKVVNDPAAHLAGQIAVLDRANIQRSIPKQSRTVRLHRTYMVGVLMSDEDVPDGMRVDTGSAHFLRQTVIVVSGINHNGGIALAVEEDICHLLSHTSDIFIDPAGVQKLKNLLAPVHPAHCFSLKFRCLFRHDRTSFLCCDAQPALFIFVVLDLIKSCLLQIRFTVHNAMLFTRCAHCSG